MKNTHLTILLLLFLTAACTTQPTTTPTGELTSPETTKTAQEPAPKPPQEGIIELQLKGNSQGTLTITSAAVYDSDNSYWATLSQDDKTIDLTKDYQQYAEKKLPVSTYNQLRLTISQASKEEKQAILTTSQIKIPQTINLNPEEKTTITIEFSQNTFSQSKDDTPVLTPAFTITTTQQEKNQQTQTLSTDINGELGVNKKIDSTKTIIIKDGKPTYEEDIPATTPASAATAAITKKPLEFKKPETMEEKREALHESVISIAEGDKKRVVIVQ